MKKILAPTDFSQTAQNAILHAAQLALEAKAQLILFHVYHMPPLSLDIPVIEPSLDLIRLQSLDSLRTIGENLSDIYGEELEIVYDNRYGFAAEEINDYALESDVDLIVMGMQGANYLSELIIGSITTSLIKEPPCPVMVVGRDMPYVKCKKIVWACDGVKSPSVVSLNHMRSVLDLFSKVNIYVVNVINIYRDDNTSFEKRVLSSIQSFLKNEEYTVHHVQHEDIVEGINRYVEEVNADMVVMAPRRHSTWKNFFFEAQTKRMAFHSIVPLLIIQP